MEQCQKVIKLIEKGYLVFLGAVIFFFIKGLIDAFNSGEPVGLIIGFLLLVFSPLFKSVAKKIVYAYYAEEIRRSI